MERMQWTAERIGRVFKQLGLDAYTRDAPPPASSGGEAPSGDFYVTRLSASAEKQESHSAS